MIHVIQTGAYTFVGEWSEMTRTMRKPRVMQVQAAPQGIKVNFVKLIGDPPEIVINAPIASYELTDKVLVDYYRSQVSGIQIVQGIQEVKNTDGTHRHEASKAEKERHGQDGDANHGRRRPLPVGPPDSP